MSSNLPKPQPETSSRRPAPGGLALLQSFINTLEIETGEDKLRSAAGLGGWLQEHGLNEAAASASAADAQHCIQVREALRDVLEANSGSAVAKSAAEALSRAARSSQLVLRFDEGGRASLQPAATGVDGAIGRILSIAYAAMIDGSWHRLKVCEDETCRWAFYDYSKNCSGNWCSMAVCGNRSKARRYRTRRKPSTSNTRASHGR
jgi:predicted RNA-binding Zn ribbon-like protein